MFFEHGQQWKKLLKDFKREVQEEMDVSSLMKILWKKKHHAKNYIHGYNLYSID